MLSPRGFPLVLSSAILKRPTLTVELWEKWHSLFLVHSDGKVEEVPFPDEGSRRGPVIVPYVDHVPNPSMVLRFAKSQGYEIDDLALELIVGRWSLDVVGLYQ